MPRNARPRDSRLPCSAPQGPGQCRACVRMKKKPADSSITRALLDVLEYGRPTNETNAELHFERVAQPLIRSEAHKRPEGLACICPLETLPGVIWRWVDPRAPARSCQARQNGESRRKRLR